MSRPLSAAVLRHVIAHIETWRIYTSVYIGLLALAAASVWHRGLPAPQVALLTFAAPTLGWVAGLYGCDYFDTELDSLEKAERPIPSGRMRKREAFVAMLVCMYAGFVASTLLSIANLLLAGVAMVAAVAYTIAKGRGLLGNVCRALPAAVTVLFGAVAAGVPALPGAWLPPLLFFIHDMSTNLVGAIRDVEGDRVGGCETVPVRHGVRVAARIATGLVVVWALLACTLPLVVPVHPVGYAAFAIPALGLAAAALAVLWRSPADRRGVLRSHKLLVIERILLTGALLVGSAQGPTAVVVVLALAALAGWAQAGLRDRHELGSTRGVPAREDAQLDRNDLERFVGASLERIATHQAISALVRSWERRGEIRIEDANFSAYFEARGGGIRRVEQAEFEASPLPAVRIRTSAAVFAAVFRHRTLSPVAAYLDRGVELDCSPLDMVRINRLFAFLLEAPAPLVIAPPTVRPAAAAPIPGRRRVVVSDTTLRDGEQMPGVRFTPEQKLVLALALDRMRVPVLEIGYPAVSAGEREAVRAIVAAQPDAQLQVISRPDASEIDLAADTGADSIALFIGTSDIHLEHKLRMTRDEVCRTVETAARHARRRHVQVVFAPEDATRTDLEFLVRVCGVAIEAGADVIGVADTVGVMTPPQMGELVGHLAAALRVPLAVHCHNDLGLATANSMAALQAGASAVQCSLSGIGERAGNAALEEVAVAARVLLGYDVGIDLSRLAETADLLHRCLPFDRAPNKAVIGANAFTHESGLHVAGVIREPSTYEPYDPETVGARRQLIFGKHSGRAGIVEVLACAGRRSEPAFVAQLANRIKVLGEEGASLTEADVVHLSDELEHVRG